MAGNSSATRRAFPYSQITKEVSGLTRKRGKHPRRGFSGREVQLPIMAGQLHELRSTWAPLRNRRRRGRLRRLKVVRLLRGLLTNENIPMLLKATRDAATKKLWIPEPRRNGTAEIRHNMKYRRNGTAEIRQELRRTRTEEIWRWPSMG